MTTSAAQVDTDYDAAITAVQLVLTDIYDASTGILGTESLADSVTEFERSVLARAGANAQKALAALKEQHSGGIVNLLEGAAYGSGTGDVEDE
jgi:hypothetical protein